MKKIIFAILIVLAAGSVWAQSRNIIMGTQKFPSDTITVTLTNTDTVWIWWAVPTVYHNQKTYAQRIVEDSLVVPSGMLPYHEPPVWNCNFYVRIKPRYVTADTESDSLQVLYQPADNFGVIASNDIRYLDFDSDANSNKNVQTLNWTSAVTYGASSSGEVVPAAFYVFTLRQFAKAVGQTSKVFFKITPF